MSGRAKRTLYTIVSALLLAGAMAGALLMDVFYGLRQEDTFAYQFAFSVFLAVTIFLPFEIFVHELGHLLLGLILGFRPVSFSVYGLIVGRGSQKSRYHSRAGGKTVMLPRGTKSIRGRLVFLAFGGALFNFVYGGALLACFFLLPPSPALFFFALFAPLNLYEGLSELLPCELSAGKTDGKMIAELLKKTPYAQSYLAVLTAQGVLANRSYAELPREPLFETPVIQADDPVALALWQLRWQYLYFIGDQEGAERQISRMFELCDEEEAPLEVLCDVIWWKRVILEREEGEESAFRGNSAAELRTRYAITGVGKGTALDAIKREKFVGIRLFEEKLIERTEETLLKREKEVK